MVGRKFRWTVAAGLSAFWLLAFLAGCSSDGATPTCTARCGELCKALASCGSAPADCDAQCSLGLGSDCSGPPADQLTCKELTSDYACADYCATLCTRAPECGSFDSKACARGCAGQSHSVCNSKSVAARTCDQLKPELRLDVEAGNAGPHEVVIGGGFGDAYGLCTSPLDCDLPLGCSAETNTCSPCATDADCAQSYPHYSCSAAHECTKVDCVVDADCFNGKFCDAELHVCGECHENADCKSAILGNVCDTKALKCVECIANADCSNDAPRCDASLHYCAPCKSDADCKGRKGTPFCDFTCVECKVDTDCTDPAYPNCNYDGTCK